MDLSIVSSLDSENVLGRVFTIGNITNDIIIDTNGDMKECFGGNLYGSLAAKMLGYDSHLKAIVGIDTLDIAKEFAEMEGVTVHFDPDEHTTVFVNDYSGGSRKQKLLGKTKKIDAWRMGEVLHLVYGVFDIVFLNPMFHEIGPEMVDATKEHCKVLSLDVQGLVRNTNPQTMEVVVDFWDDREKYLEGLDILKVGHDEISAVSMLNNRKAICEELYSLGPEIIVLTLGVDGSLIYDGMNHEYHTIPAFKTNIVDETGAGDVYTTAFGIRYLETRDTFESGLFAAAAASFVVEDYGLKGIAPREKVEGRYEILKEMMS